MNPKRLTRELRRLARQDVPDEPDLWPAIRTRITRRQAGRSTNTSVHGRSRATGSADVSSVYTWHADSRRSQFGTGARIVAAGLALIVLVGALALIFGNQSGDQSAVGAGGTSSPTLATPVGWSETGVSVASIVPLNGSDVGGKVYAQVYPSGDMRLSGSPTGSEPVLFWHVVSGSCEPWTASSGQGTPAAELQPPFYSQSTGRPVQIDEVIPEAKTHQPVAIIAYASDGMPPLACASIPAVPPSLKVTLPIDSSNPGSCPVTRPEQPLYEPPASHPHDPAPPNYFWYGTNDLWTLLPVNGAWTGLPYSANTGYAQKIFWMSVNYQGASVPELEVSGRRLDAFVPPLYVTRPTNGASGDMGSFMLTGVEFPTSGCWQVTGAYKGHSLSFVVWVPSLPPPATSTPAPSPSPTPAPTPLACTKESDVAFLQKMIAAFNRGDQTALARYFPDDSVPSNVSVPRFIFKQQDGAGFSIDSRTELLAAFAQRHAHNETWQLGKVYFGGGGGNVSMTIESDSTPLRTLFGKISFDCPHGWITFWHMTDTVGTAAQMPFVPVTLPNDLPLADVMDQFTADELGGSCDPNDGVRPLMSVLDAYNQGDQQKLASVFPAQTGQPLFAVESTDGTIWSASSRDKLLAELARRQDAGERWTLDRLDVTSQTHGGSFVFRLSIQQPGTAKLISVGSGLLNCDSGQILIWTMLEQAPTPLEQTDALWSDVSSGVGATIDPILRPTQFPDGIDGANLLNASDGAFAVVYAGVNQNLWFGVGGFDPMALPASPTRSRQQVAVRGQPANLVIEDTANPGDQVWLWWYEPGAWVENGQQQPDGVLYYISATGLTPDQVVQFANSLTPVAGKASP